MAVHNHSIITGQSLATFNQGTSLSGTQTRPTEITYFSGGSRLPLEKNNQWPERTLADTAADPSPYLFNIITAAVAGKAYVDLKKGTALYSGVLANLTAGVSGAAGDGHTVIVRALHVIHGEADSSFGTSRVQYKADLIEWLADYNTDCKAITGQDFDMIGIAHQVSFYQGTDPAHAVLDVHRQADRWWCVGPIYQLPPSSPNGPHLTNEGSFLLGEYHAKVHRAVVIDGGTWEPVHPQSIVRSGAVIEVDFHVPVEPLVLDTSTLSQRTNYGFVYTDDEESASIDTVELTGPAQVTITLDAEPDGTNERLRYGPPAATWGGNLRDSDPAVSTLDDETPLHNWCCYFSDPITVAEVSPTAGALRGVDGELVVQYSRENGSAEDMTESLIGAGS